MARTCLVCGYLCAYFLLFFKITAVLSLSDRNIYYNIAPGHNSHKSKHQLHFELLQSDDEHTIEKRELPPQSVHDIETYPTTARPVLKSNTTSPPNDNNKSKLPKQSIKTEPITSYHKINVLSKDIEKLLGENGTGQRMTTFKPPILLTHLLNQTNSSITPPPIDNRTVLQETTSTSTTSSILSPDDADVSIFSNSFNNTLAKNNITNSRNDTYTYYNSTLMTLPDVSADYWVDLDNNNYTKISELLSKSHRRAATIHLSFDFPFYGHQIRNVTIATGGFLYTGDYVHTWLAATQYIAPLMANFDTSLSNDSHIRYADNGSAFTVEWEKVSLQDKPAEGEFTFQTTLHSNGDIVFVYRNVPVFIEQIQDDHHPVKVGLSDAYIIDRTIFFMNRKTIYEYHRVNFDKEDIKNGTVIYLKALPTCLESKDCVSCLTRKLANFQCVWCPAIKRCSNGVDRNRQEWVTKKCETRQVKNDTMCSHIDEMDSFDGDHNRTYTEFADKSKGGDGDDESLNSVKALGVKQPVKMGVSGIVAILFLIAMVSGLAVWILYAYRNPHTTSGQILIRYRPSQWTWRRGEARYTAATIHM